MTLRTGQSESSLVLAPDLLAVREARAFVLRTLQSAGVPARRIEDLQLALSELASNALRHSARPPTHLEVRVRLEQGQLCVSLLEDGTPFVTEPDAAEPVEAVDPEAESGRGIGLVNALFPGWSRGIESGPEGMRNCCVLHVALDGAPVAESPRVALVDDDPMQLALLRAYLESDYRVSCFSGAEQLLGQGVADGFDLIVSDISMPGIDGIELWRRLQQRAELRSKPFLFLSGVDDGELLESAISSGIDDFLSKPVDRRRLRGVIERVLARNRMIREAIGSRLDAAITDTLRARVPARIGQWTAVLHSQPGGPGGGDFVYFRESAACSWLLLGDVMGHGVDAKFFAHAYAGHISGLAATMSDSAMPSDWLRGMSRSLAEDRLLERCLMTCLVLRIERDGTIWVASAGHPSPLLCRGGLIAERVRCGPLLGFDPAAGYDDERIDAGPGRLLLITDGLLEIGDDPAGRAAAQRAVYETVAATAVLPPEAALAAILATAAAQASTAPRDDLTLLMLDFEPDS